MAQREWPWPSGSARSELFVAVAESHAWEEHGDEMAAYAEMVMDGMDEADASLIISRVFTESYADYPPKSKDLIEAIDERKAWKEKVQRPGVQFESSFYGKCDSCGHESEDALVPSYPYTEPLESWPCPKCEGTMRPYT